MGTSDAWVYESRRRVPRWAGRTAKTFAGSLTTIGAAMAGVASIPSVAVSLNDFFHLGWFGVATRVTGTALSFLGAVWVISANHKEKDEIEVLRKAVTKAEGQGLSHATAEFRHAVQSIVAANDSGWTPENVKRFQPEALKFGKSLLDYLGVPEVRVCLYEPGAAETEPEETGGANITVLSYVYATPVSGRHDPSDSIIRSPDTAHMFQALASKKPHHNRKRKRLRTAGDLSKRWRSSICLGVRAGNEPFALLTVDSTAEKAFDNASEGVLTLLADLLAFAEVEKDRARQVHIAQRASTPSTLELADGRR